MLANTSNHANSLLGLWVATQNDWIKSFGDNIYDVVVDGQAVDLLVSELYKWSSVDNHGPQFYIAKRQELLGKGVDYLRVVEDDGRSMMGIVLNFDAIKCFDLHMSRASLP